MNEELIRKVPKGNAELKRIGTLLDEQVKDSRRLPESFLVPILALREKHFVYSVVEHAADESVRDGETVDVKLSALLAAQAAIPAIFLDKQGWYLIAAVIFTGLTIFSICSLRTRRYRRAPNPAYFC